MSAAAIAAALTISIPSALAVFQVEPDIAGTPGTDLGLVPRNKSALFFGGDDFVTHLGGAGQIDAGDGDDWIFAPFGGTVVGGHGNDRVTGLWGRLLVDAGPGDDTVKGSRESDDVGLGPGDDWVDLRDDHPDVLDCGDGVDTALVDAEDRSRRCEMVRID